MLHAKGIGKVLIVISLVFLTGSLLPLCPSAEGAPNFPKKPVTLICIYDAGSTSDIIIRSLADSLSKELGQRVIVVNKVGDFMIERYGDFVLYRPRMTAQNFLLGAAPALLLLGAAVVLVRVVRRRAQETDIEPEGPEAGQS